jgi:hypothetical protein
MTARLRARVARDFALPELTREVAALLETLTGLIETTEGEERIQAAIVLAASGDIDRILAGVELARVDWRDVLVNGGLAEQDWRSVLRAELGS